jgi:hypothetical protein
MVAASRIGPVFWSEPLIKFDNCEDCDARQRQTTTRVDYDQLETPAAPMLRHYTCLHFGRAQIWEVCGVESLYVLQFWMLRTTICIGVWSLCRLCPRLRLRAVHSNQQTQKRGE